MARRQRGDREETRNGTRVHARRGVRCAPVFHDGSERSRRPQRVAAWSPARQSLAAPAARRLPARQSLAAPAARRS
eukprot:539141-Prymnesium_polylepis.1